MLRPYLFSRKLPGVLLMPSFLTDLTVLPILISAVAAIIGASLFYVTYRRLNGNPLVGIALGGVAGAIAPVLFMLPLNYCTFEAERDPADVLLGLVLIVVGLAIVLLPLRWIVSRLLQNAPLAGDTTSPGAFKSRLLPLFLLAPTLIILAMFLYYPSLETFRLSTLLARLDARRTAFICVDNFTRLLRDPGDGQSLLTLIGIAVGLMIAGVLVLRFAAHFTDQPLIGTKRRAPVALRYGVPLIIGVVLYSLLFDAASGFFSEDYGRSLLVTFGISIAIVVIGLSLSLLIATMAYQPITGAKIYRTLLIWPYAISPVVAGAIFLLLFNPSGGIINYFLRGAFGFTIPWLNDPAAAPWAIILASVWKSMGFNILFYLAGLQNVPKDLLEAGGIDGANAFQRFRHIVIPMLSPITFFLIITNMTYAFFESFGTVDTLTNGGPLNSTSTLMYEIYEIGIQNSDLGKAAAQSIILFVMVIGLTVIQFRSADSRVTYGA